jgi:hypothetical protein
MAHFLSLVMPYTSEDAGARARKLLEIVAGQAPEPLINTKGLERQLWMLRASRFIRD